MRVLMISGDPNLTREGTNANARYKLQATAVDALEAIIWPQEFFKPFFVQGKFDTVTSQDPFWRGLAAWVAARRLHARLNVQVHADLGAQSPIKRSLARFVLARATTVRVVSERVKAQVARITSAPISTLPIFINLNKFLHLQKSPHPRFPKTILWIGRFEDEKDPLRALNVLAQVRASGVDAGLIMLGTGSYHQKLLEQTKKAELTPYVEFPGWQDPAEYFKWADVVLCTSRAESFGASIVEALASGTPVVAPDVGIARDAGAIIAEKEELALQTIHVLKEPVAGRLLTPVLNEEQWAVQWKKTL